MKRLRWAGVLALAGLLAAPVLRAQSTTRLPPGMSFVAQDAAGAWRLYRVDERGAAVAVPTQQEPRQACVAPGGAKAVYAAADGTLRLVSLAGGQETVIARPNAQRSFTQPCLSADGRDVYAVEMADGKSIDTEIVRWVAGNDAPLRFARQPGAQHDPFVHQGRWLVYASVGCSDGCEQLLVEIWGRDLVAGQTRQLTLLNALSQSPVTDGRRVVFSSNASGSFQLWQVGADGSGIRRLTEGAAQAVSPALCGAALHFVRAGPGGSAIARLADDGTVVEIPVPGLTSFRALRCVS